MVQELKQSTAIVVHVGPFVDVGDGFTPETGVTLSGADEAEVLKNAATTTTSISGLTFAAITSCDGWYALSLTTSETDTLGHLEVIVHDDSVCLPVHVRFEVVTANVFDSRYSTDKLEVDVTQWLGTATPAPGTAGVPSVDVLRWNTAVVAVPTVAGVPEVDVTHMEGGTQTVTDLKDFADNCYIPGTNSVSLVDTVTTNTDLVTAASTADAVWDESRNDHLTDNSMGHIMKGLAPTDGAIEADGGNSPTQLQTDIGTTTDDAINGQVFVMTSGGEIGQSRLVIDYDGATGRVTLEPALTGTPSVGEKFVLISQGFANLRTATQTSIDAIETDTADIQPKIGTPAADLAADIAAVKVDTAATLVDTADMQPKLGSPAADVSADIAAVKVDTAAILVDTGTTLDTKINDIQGATFSSATDSLEAIRDRGDAAWITGAGGSDPFVLQNTTIATLASQVSFTLTAGSADDDAYNGMLAIVEDVSTATQKCVGVISDYTGSSKTITLREDPGVFTMAATDTIDVVAVSPDILDILADTADIQPKLGSPAADLSADVAAVKVDTAATLVDTADMQPKIGSPAADLAADIAAVPTANENADGVLDRANAIETGLTFRQAQRLIASSVAGKLSGGATTTIITREAVNDSKARITATVDSDGNRSAITWDVT